MALYQMLMAIFNKNGGTEMNKRVMAFCVFLSFLGYGLAGCSG